MCSRCRVANDKLLDDHAEMPQFSQHVGGVVRREEPVDVALAQAAVLGPDARQPFGLGYVDPVHEEVEPVQSLAAAEQHVHADARLAHLPDLQRVERGNRGTESVHHIPERVVINQVVTELDVPQVTA